MAVNPKKIIQGVLIPAAAAASPGLFASPANTKTLVKKLVFTNTDTTARQLTVHVVASGGTASASNMVTTSTTVIPAGGTYECFEAYHILESGDFIAAFSDVASKVACQGTGVYL